MNWKEIRDYPGYFVSDEGHIRTTGLRPGLLKPATERGYKRVHLTNNKKGRSIRVHRLVADAFIPNPLNLPYVNHKDADKSNNHATNLEWCTHDNNMKHAWALGLPKTHYGESHGMSRLTEHDVLNIRRLYSTGKTSYPKLSRQFGISISHAHRIVSKQIWKTV
jgi:hypothetical protein